MKLRLLYLLLLCFLAFKGYSYTHAKQGKISFTQIACWLAEHKSGRLISKQSPAKGLQDCLICDDGDNEDDETSVSKKETISFNKSYTQNNLDVLSLLLHSFKKYACVRPAFFASSSRRYISLRVFRL